MSRRNSGYFVSHPVKQIPFEYRRAHTPRRPQPASRPHSNRGLPSNSKRSNHRSRPARPPRQQALQSTRYLPKPSSYQHKPSSGLPNWNIHLIHILSIGRLVYQTLVLQTVADATENAIFSEEATWSGDAPVPAGQAKDGTSAPQPSPLRSRIPASFEAASKHPEMRHQNILRCCRLQPPASAPPVRRPRQRRGLMTT